MVLVVDPNLNQDQYRNEEAQVELITAYRNILSEVAEYNDPRSHRRLCRQIRDENGGRADTPVSVLRIPALSLYSSGPQFEGAMGKLSQQSVIKAFHRLSQEAKETLIKDANFKVELYIPGQWYGEFQKAFSSEAWATPESILMPGRLNLYPGLAPPEQLLQYEGWVGKRPELLEAVQTRGKSLTTGTLKGTDGHTIECCDVHTLTDVFSTGMSSAKLLEGERQTAEAQGLKREVPDSSTPLFAGLQGGDGDGC
jgi:hypothetical protein